MLVAISIIAVAAAIALFLCATPRGFVSLPTGFLLRLSALLARTAPVPREVKARRRKNDSDALIVSAKPSAALSVEDRAIDGPGGSIPLRLYKPLATEPHSVLLFVHGGGWVVGGVESADPVARALCLASGALVVSPGYRLAPENPFPAAIDDVMACYEWILGEISAGRIASRGVFVSGDSAGGNLAAAICIQARERKLAQPAGQVLFYPVTDISRTNGPSYQSFAEGFLLDREDMEWFIALYAPDEPMRKDPRASPLLAPDLSGLAPALILTAAYDVLRDEGEAYAAALREAGVEVEARRMGGLVHGFLSMSRFVPSSLRCARMAGAFMRKRVGRA
jgi:acetyl esterase